MLGPNQSVFGSAENSDYVPFPNNRSLRMTVYNAQCTRYSLDRIATLALLVVGLAVVGCDTTGVGDETDDPPSTEISGQATDDRSSKETISGRESEKVIPKAAVEGAVVTATAVSADGTTRSLDGEATTNADGEFTLEASGTGADQVIRLHAEGEEEYTSGSVVLVDGENEVRTQPLTGETKAEADVYTEAKATDGASDHRNGVTPADVTVYVDGDAAASINSGATSASDVATAIAASVEAESEAITDSEDGANPDDVSNAKASAFAQFQSDLATTENTEERAQAVAAFEDAIANLYVDAGASEESQAQSRQVGTSVMIEFSTEMPDDGELGLRKQSELLRAEATARAQEAIFEAQGASSATMDALVNAREQLKADIRAATSVDAIVSAKSDYSAEVTSQMESTFDVSATTVAEAESAVEASVSALLSALSEIEGVLGSAVDVTKSAYSTYYTDAQADARTAFEAELDADQADAAARALVLLSAQHDA